MGESFPWSSCPSWVRMVLQEWASTLEGFFGMGEHQQRRVQCYPCPQPPQGIPWSSAGLPGEPGLLLGTDCTFVPGVV